MQNGTWFGRAISFGLDATLSRLSRAGRHHPEAHRWCEGVDVQTDLPYRSSDHPAHRLDIYRPTHIPPPWPVLMYVHGGGFTILSKDSHWMFGYGFAQRGFLVFNVDYRRAPTHPFPAAADDVAHAILWILENAQRYGGDTEHLVYAGESAGANLITALTIAGTWPRPEPWAKHIFERHPQPKVILPACGLLQVSNAERYLRRTDLPRWMRARLKRACQAYLPDPDSAPERGALADPLNIFETHPLPERPLPAVFAPCGDRDPVLNDTERLAKALSRFDIPFEAPTYEGGHHAFQAVFWHPLARRFWDDQMRFLKRHLPPSCNITVT